MLSTCSRLLSDSNFSLAHYQRIACSHVAKNSRGIFRGTGHSASSSVPTARRGSRGLIAPDAKQLESFLANIDPKGGGDLPESLYDGAMKVLAEVDWDSERRVLVIMTDAGPTDRDTHSLDDVVRLAGDHGVSIVAIMVGL